VWLSTNHTIKEEGEQKRTPMTWTFTNLVIEIIAGAIGGCAIAAAAKEYNFGILSHVVTGALGGALSGYFLSRSRRPSSIPPATYTRPVINPRNGLCKQ
jgi:hypothetical protein